MTRREEIATCLDDYRASEPAIRNRKRAASLFECFKWKAIREGMRKIDLEEASG
jgi:hypothetical protein